RLSLGIAWLVIVAAEMLTGSPGVGGFFLEGYNNLVYENIIICIATICIIGFIFERFMSPAEKRFKTAERFMIYDLRFMISCAYPRGVEYLCQLFGFDLNFHQPFGWQKTCTVSQLNPKKSFIRFLKDNCNFIDEVRSRFAAKRGAVIRSNRT